MKRWFVLAGVLTLSIVAASVRGGDDDKPAQGKRPGAKGRGKGGDMIEAAFKRMDANGDGKISLDEFKKAAEGRAQGKLKDNPEMAKKIFERMDANGDGFVSLEEFKKAREKIAERLRNGKGGARKPGEKKPDDKKPEGKKDDK
jgi:hypothetical protein